MFNVDLAKALDAWIGLLASLSIVATVILLTFESSSLSPWETGEECIDFREVATDGKAFLGDFLS